MRLRAVALASCLAMAGCGLVGPPHTGPDGLTSYDGDLRRFSATSRFDEAVKLAEEKGDDAGDELLALLNQATVEHYAGRYEASNTHLQAADLLIEERFTRSISRAALSLVTSDRSLVWLPGRSERLMVHVYGALNYLALQRPGEAAVEARRLGMLLDEVADEDGLDGLGAEERRLYRSLRYFAGAVFDQAGEFNDADVAYRHAGLDSVDVREDAAAARRGAKGTVIVLVESGFVAHRVEQSAHLFIGLDDLDGLRYGSDDDRRYNARCFSHRNFGYATNHWGEGIDSCPAPGYRPRPQSQPRKLGRKNGARGDKKDDKRDLAYLMRVAWPAMHRPASSRSIGTVQAFAASPGPNGVLMTAARDATALGFEADAPDATPAPSAAESPAFPSASPLLSADLSGAVEAEFARDLPEILIKSVVRAAVKYAAVQAVEDGARKEDETLGDVAAILGNAFAAVTERADTRAWTLLPADLQIVRLELPAGPQNIRVAGTGSSARRLDLGEIDVRPGRVTVLAVRAWP